ncbi:peptidase M24, structural domain-containing protein [Suillus clintonianus]|uniref:peptidase M24, structural domain-containing protein n=1 Tax=Suillus clintonianus TaxID=1904413 RepID=UPI001B878851|nr:peptidase M24, structural domain-containing protein [Suillus clintonianus]KAG2149388.1 peptidase M24, structural domain-containing protein [Suillus clintonianus]
MGKVDTSVSGKEITQTFVTPKVTRSREWRLFFSLAICATIFYLQFFTDISPESYSVDYDPWAGLASHCADAQRINGSEFLQRQENLAKILYDNGASAYVVEPGANAQYFGNISEASWHLSERPLLLVIFPTLKEASIVAKITVVTPAFEETRARLLPVPGIDVSYISWAEDEDPYTVALDVLSTLEGPIYVDGMMRYFIVDGLQKAAPGVRVMSAPPEVTQLRARKSPAELDLLRCANEVTVLCIRAVQAQMYIGIRESQVLAMVDESLAVAGLTERWALVLFGENAALPHGSGSDRVLGKADLILIDTGGVLFEYNSDVTRTFMLHDSSIPLEHTTIWYDVHTAQTLAHVAAREGVNTSAVDKVARDWLDGRGYHGYFTHRLGHGIGLEDHEAPYLRGGTDDIIQTGNAFSNEPGVYIEGKVGIRLEDCFYINEDGNPVFLTKGIGGQARSPLYP